MVTFDSSDLFDSPDSRAFEVDTAIFDVDGTLVDTNYQHALAWYRAFRRYDWVCQRWLAPPCQVWLAPPVGEVGLADPRLELDVDGS